MTDEIKPPAADIPVPADAASKTIDPGKDGLDSAIDRITERVAARATDGRFTAAAPGKRKAGWPKGKPRKVSVADMDSAPGQVLPGAGGPVAGQPAPVATIPPALDLAAIEAMVEGIVSLMDEFAGSACERLAMQKTGDAHFSGQCRQKALMSEKTRALLKVGGVGCARKYALSYNYVEETALAIGIGVWAFGLTSSLRALRRLPDPKKLEVNGET